MAQGGKEKLLKILVIGDYAVGKTSIIRRYVEDTFSANYKLTIGVDFSLKKIKRDHNTVFHVQLWDVAGHERFAHLSRVYYKSAIAAIIVFDMTRSGEESVQADNLQLPRPVMSTFESVAKWAADVRSKVALANGDPIPIMLLGNKCDHESVEVNEAVVEEYVDQQHVIGWFKTSAKESINIEEAMEYLLETIGRSKYEPEHTSDKKAHRLGHRANDLDLSVEEEEVQLSNTVEPEKSSCCLR